MKPSKILDDLIVSANSAKTHFEVWWAQANEARPQLVDVMNRHSDFFHASSDAHYMAFFVCLAHLYDKRTDSSSIPTYLTAIASTLQAFKPFTFSQSTKRWQSGRALSSLLGIRPLRTLMHD